MKIPPSIRDCLEWLGAIEEGTMTMVRDTDMMFVRRIQDALEQLADEDAANAAHDRMKPE